jgi:type IV pilus assembly protein PilV
MTQIRFINLRSAGKRIPTAPGASVSKQSGSVLLEALVSILIFSFGILGLMGLQASSVRNSNEARIRADAIFLANQYISQILIDSSFPGTGDALTRTNSMITRYASPSGTAYASWKTQLESAGIDGVTLPRIAEFPPTVTITNGDTVRTVNVQVTLRWALPGEVGNRQYTLSTSIGRNS